MVAPSVVSGRVAAIAILVALPWLNPFTFGPSAAMVQWLLSLASLVGLVLVAAWCGMGRGGRLATFWDAGLAWGWLLAGLLSSLIALLQYTGHSAAWAPWVNFTPAGEAFANLRQRNQFATLTNVALASLCWVVVTRGGGLRAWHVLIAVMLGVGNAASASRTGLL